MLAIELDEATYSSNNSQLICYITLWQGVTIIEDIVCKFIEERSARLSSYSTLQTILLSAQTCSKKFFLEFAPLDIKRYLVDVRVYKNLRFMKSPSPGVNIISTVIIDISDYI